MRLRLVDESMKRMVRSNLRVKRFLSSRHLGDTNDVAEMTVISLVSQYIQIEYNFNLY
jgi:hypothetical protein